jgi:amidase
VGLKATYGRVSRAGIYPLAWSLDHAGPLARTVTDAALMLARDPSLVGNSAREIEIGGKAFVLYHCPRCTRDFAREPGRSGWRAVHVGVHKVHYLHDSLSHKWVSESCPEIPRS